MKERPIIFSAPMVRALLDWRKTMTRRIMKPQPKLGVGAIAPNLEDVRYGVFRTWLDRTNEGHGKMDHDYNPQIWRCPYGQPGDRLWVKRTHWLYGHWRKDGHTKTGRRRWRFVAIGQDVQFEPPKAEPDSRTTIGYHKRPSIFMPRWASRITLELTSVRVERVQDITETDAKSEGLVSWKSGYPRSTGCPPAGYITLWSTAELKGWTPAGRESPVQAYRSLWDSLNAKRGFGWETNPWVWAISFKVVKPVTQSADPDAIDRAEYQHGRKGEP